MKRPINHDMIRLEDVLSAIDAVRNDIRNGTRKGMDQDEIDSRLEVVDKIKRSIRAIETRRRLVIIDGGKE